MFFVAFEAEEELALIAMSALQYLDQTSHAFCSPPLTLDGISDIAKIANIDSREVGFEQSPECRTRGFLNCSLVRLRVQVLLVVGDGAALRIHFIGESNRSEWIPLLAGPAHKHNNFCRDRTSAPPLRYNFF